MPRQCILFCLALLVACSDGNNRKDTTLSPVGVMVTGALRDVMWNGKLGGVINLDSLSKKGSYGLGPESYLRGELLLMDGKAFVSRVTSDTTMEVMEESDLTAPFFVYTSVEKWEEVSLPDSVNDIRSLEEFLNQSTKEHKRPFAFRLEGRFGQADIHIQALPEGREVRSPEEAHQGQTNYLLNNQDAEIIGFFSTEYAGIFTHHDSFIHMHLISKDKAMMGHLDQLEFNSEEIKFYISDN